MPEEKFVNPHWVPYTNPNNLEDFRITEGKDKGWLDVKKFGYQNGDLILADIGWETGKQKLVKGIINGMCVSHGGEPLTIENVNMMIEFKENGHVTVERIYRPHIIKKLQSKEEVELAKNEKRKPKEKKEDAQLSMF